MVYSEEITIAIAIIGGLAARILALEINMVQEVRLSVSKTLISLPARLRKKPEPKAGSLIE